MSPNYKLWIIITYTNILEGIYMTLKISVIRICVCEVQLWFTYSFYSHHNIILNSHWQNRIATVINMLANKVYPVTEKFFVSSPTDTYIVYNSYTHFFNVAQNS